MAIAFDDYAPFDIGAGADTTEPGWRAMMRRALITGVIRNTLNQMEVFGDSSGQQVKVKTGDVVIEGHWGTNTTQKTVPITPNTHATWDRYDRVVARVTFSAGQTGGKIELDVLQGTPAASPTIPALQQTSALWEISLARVLVVHGAASVTAGNVQDWRHFADFPGQLMRLGWRTTATGFSTAEQGVLRLAPIYVRPGHNYRFGCLAHPRSFDTTGDRFTLGIRYTLDGTTPSTGSTALSGGGVYQTATLAGSTMTIYWEAKYEATSEGLFWPLLTVDHVLGSGTASAYADADVHCTMRLYYDGPAKSNEGTAI